MNKQQLAAKIWNAANKMRSKIEANEYKDYILGFIFYKFLSEKEEKFLADQQWTKEYYDTMLIEDNASVVEYIQNNIGYFISKDNLFSKWLSKGKDFSIADVRQALSAFSRLINPTHKNVFEGIFTTLDTGLSKLGDSESSRTKAISDLIELIKDIPMNDTQDYDVLGFIYEYLISNFAANAGKKAGEFYTPHEVSLLMSEIVANHLKNKDEIKILDPTSGSGSLLINIGKSVAKHSNNPNGIKYYAQELKENTYNLTRMNLVMKGIIPSNIVARCGDTLEDDWPFFEEGKKDTTYDPVFVDAVVSNPPYSQAYNEKNKESDPRFAYGVAPKSKADYAFLLHDLYHINNDGIVTIVLPHGVLFRGGSEGEIRKNLIEEDRIDTIIGLPANIFFGTGIPTIIMVLKKQRTNSDVLIIDASKGFVKEGKQNKLLASHIKKIADTVFERKDIEKFSRVVSKAEIRANEYNLNIPRYVDSSEEAEKWDIYSLMNGGIPYEEIDLLHQYWDAFPGLKKDLFKETGIPYTEVAHKDIKAIINNHAEVMNFKNAYVDRFADLREKLSNKLVYSFDNINVTKTEREIGTDLFNRLNGLPLVDKYDIYQILDNAWKTIEGDVEILQKEGINAARVVDPKMVSKSKDGKESEVQEGWIGRILPFDLIQSTMLTNEKNSLTAKNDRVNAIDSELNELVESISEEDRGDFLTQENDAFVPKNLVAKIKECYENISNPEIDALKHYLTLPGKKEKLLYANQHREVSWSQIAPAKDGTYGKKPIETRISALQSEFVFEEGTVESILIKANTLLNEQKEIKGQIKIEAAKLETLTKETIEKLTDEEAYHLIEIKWLDSMIDEIKKLPEKTISELIKKVEYLSEKYETTYSEIDNEIEETEASLVEMLGELTGNEFDMKGINELFALLGGESNGK